MIVRRGNCRLAAAAAAAAAALLAAATGCTSDDGATGQPGRATSTSTTTTAPRPTTTQPTDPAVYTSTLDRLIAEVEGAQGDLCALRGIAEGASAAGSPTNGEQAVKAAEFISVVYGAIGDAAPDRKDGAVISAAAAQIRSETEAPDFDLQKFLERGPSAFSDDEFRGAVQRVLGASQAACGPPTTTAQTGVPSTTGP